MTSHFVRVLACALPLLLTACGGSPEVTSSTTVAVSAAKRGNAEATASAYYDVVQRVYLAYYGRPADPAGLEYWAGQYKTYNMPLSIAEISSSYSSNATVQMFVDFFGVSDEASALYSGDNNAFVVAIYRNLFNRDGDAAGRAFWVDALNRGAMTRGIAALYIMSGAQSTDITSIEKKLEIAKSFTTALNTDARRQAYAGLSATAVARTMLSTVNETTDTASFTGVTTAINALLASTAGQHLFFNYDIGPDFKSRIGLLPAAGGPAVSTAPDVRGQLVSPLTTVTVQNGQVSNGKTPAILVWKNQRLYRQSLLSTTATPGAELRSTLSLDQVCSEQSEMLHGFDFVDADLSYFVFRQPGADASCNSADDLFAAVRMNMGGTTSPLQVNQPLFGIHAANGALTGFLVKDRTQVKRVDTNFANPVLMFTLPGVLSDEVNRLDLLNNQFLFQSDDKLYVWDASSTTAGTPTLLSTIGESDRYGDVRATDNAEIFVMITSESSVKVLRYSLATKEVTTLATFPVPLYPSATMYLSATKVLVYNNNTGTVTSVPRSGGAPQTLYTSNSSNAAALIVEGERVWITSFLGNIASIKTDGSGLLNLPGATFAGCVEKTISSFSLDGGRCQSILFVDGVVLKDIDALTGIVGTTYGSFPVLDGVHHYSTLNSATPGQAALISRMTTQAGGQSYSLSTFLFKPGSVGLTEVKVQ